MTNVYIYIESVQEKEIRTILKERGITDESKIEVILKIIDEVSDEAYWAGYDLRSERRSLLD